MRYRSSALLLLAIALAAATPDPAPAAPVDQVDQVISSSELPAQPGADGHQLETAFPGQSLERKRSARAAKAKAKQPRAAAARNPSVPVAQQIETARTDDVRDAPAAKVVDQDPPAAARSSAEQLLAAEQAATKKGEDGPLCGRCSRKPTQHVEAGGKLWCDDSKGTFALRS